MVRRLVSGALAVLAMLIVAAAAQGQDLLPAERFVYTPDTDFPGGDLAALYDTTEAACARSCRADRNCGAFTFNARANACFPKSGVLAASPYSGAISAVKVATDPGVLQAAAARRPQLDFLTDADLEAAAALVADNARRYPGGDQEVDALGRSLAAALATIAGLLIALVTWLARRRAAGKAV